jgi:uncharacterized protein YbjQ (UPF0145 family)
MTSDLSIDEELVLHSIGWEPVELVSGASMYSVPVGVWNWGQGEIVHASDAYARSFAAAVGRLHDACTHAGGHGVVGVHVEWAVERHHVDVTLVGTAVRPVGATGLGTEPVFVSDLSNYTEAMYAAREAAMERMQTAALGMGGTGVVEVKVTEGPMEFARHAVGFTAYGTVVRLLPGGHRDLGAQMVLPLDDPVVSFDATSLRGR